jgi:26S proteasome regulatory subunit N2
VDRNRKLDQPNVSSSDVEDERTFTSTNPLSCSEELYEEESFPERELAALVAAKVYYHLGDYNESMAFALGAGKYFSLEHTGEFEDTIISKCVDTYIALSANRDPSLATASGAQQPLQLSTAFPHHADGATNTSANLISPTTPFSQSALPSRSLLSRENTATFDQAPLDAGSGLDSTPESIVQQRGIQKQLQRIIEQLFEQCFQSKRYRQVVGIAIEARNLDVLRRVILRASEDEKKENGDVTRHGKELMDYVLDICMSVVQERGLRNEVRSVPGYFRAAR